MCGFLFVFIRENIQWIKYRRATYLYARYDLYVNVMAQCDDDDAINRALVELNMHCITKEMVSSHVLLYMPSMAGK